MTSTLTKTVQSRTLPYASAAANELGIQRILGAIQAFGWSVGLSRQGQAINRKFQDGSYGGWQDALTEALAYRDVVLSALPPHTYDEINEHRLLGEHPGVQKEDSRWRARAHVDGIRRTKSFSIRRFGEKGAKERAIAAWHEMMARKGTRFHTHSPKSAQVAAALFSDRLDHSRVQRLSREEVEGVIARIDAEFDARRPHWIHVSVNMAGAKRIRVYVSGGNSPPLQQDRKSFRFGQSSLDWVLQGPVNAFIEKMITEIYDHETAMTFLEMHGAVLNGIDFDPASGFNIRVKWPLKENV